MFKRPNVGRMDLDYDEEQLYLQREARRFLEAQAPLDRMRRVFEGQESSDEKLWRAVARQGWLGIDIPEEHGGVGLGVVELAAISEVLGASLAAIPFAPTVYGFARAIAQFGSPEQQDDWLARLAAGEIVGAAALFEGAADLSPETLDARLENGKLTGIKQPVEYAPVATHFLVLAVREGQPVLVIADRDVAQIETLEAIDRSTPVGAVRFDAVPVTVLADCDWTDVTRLLSGMAALTAFEQIGLADRCLDLTCEYVKQRSAFGGPIGRFQAVKHKLADIYTANQIARSHAYGAIAALASTSDRLVQAAAGARIAASDAAWVATKEMIHLHGGIGFTWEHDAHLFYRRAHHLSVNLGAPDWWKALLYTEMRTSP